MSGATTGYKPSNGQFQIYNTTFGYLTAPPGYCSGGVCHVFPAINDEFGCVAETNCSPGTIPGSIGLLTIARAWKLVSYRR